MKLASTLYLLLSIAGSAVAFVDFSQGDFLFGAIEGTNTEDEEVTSSDGQTTKTHDFTLYGGVPPTTCFDLNKVCDLQVYGDLSWTFCLAAHKAISWAKIGYGIKASLSVTRSPGRVTEVNIESAAASSLLSSTFVQSAAAATAGTDTQVKVLTESDTKGDLTFAASLAFSNSVGKTVATSKATSLNSVATGSTTFTANKIQVEGTSIDIFNGRINGVVGLFSSTAGLAGVDTHSKGASEAFALAVTAAQKEWSTKLIVDTNSAGARAKATAAQRAFATTFTESISRLLILYTAGVKVENGVAVLGAGAASTATFTCAPPVSTP